MGRYVAVVVLIALATAARADVVAPLTSIPLTFGLMNVTVRIKGANGLTAGSTVMRAYAEVGGRMINVDSGSSAIAFCEEPLGVQDATPLLNGEGEELSSFVRYGEVSNGINTYWFGKTYTGGLPWGSSGSILEANYSVMEEVENTNGVLTSKTLGANDMCGTPSPERGALGITRNSEGILGIGTKGEPFMPSRDIIYSEESESWSILYDNISERERVLKSTNTESSFMRSIRSLPPEEQKFALTWNGSLGPNTGALLIGREAVLNQSVGHPSAMPKAIMRISQLGHYQFIVVGMYLEDRDGDDPVLINQTATTNASFGDPPGVKYVFDSGNPQMFLPLETKSQILTILDARNITDFTLVFTIADLWKGPPAVILKFDLNLTAFDRFEFVDTSNPYQLPIWGLPSMAFLQEVRFFVGGSADKNCTLGCSMDKDGKELVSYMQFVEREREDGDRILYSLVNDPEALLVQ